MLQLELRKTATERAGNLSPSQIGKSEECQDAQAPKERPLVLHCYCHNVPPVYFYRPAL
jgi:hypothetical protein